MIKDCLEENHVAFGKGFLIPGAVPKSVVPCEGRGLEQGLLQPVQVMLGHLKLCLAVSHRDTYMQTMTCFGCVHALCLQGGCSGEE